MMELLHFAGLLFFALICSAQVVSAQPEPGCTDTDGTFYPVGASVPRDDPCLFCRCFDSDGVYEIVCATPGCALPDCDYEFFPDECCPRCVGCKDDDGNVYAVGDSVPSQSGNPCELCYCEDTFEIGCYIHGCPPPQCEDYFVPDGECCPQCPTCTQIDPCRIEVGGQELGTNCCHIFQCNDYSDDPLYYELYVDCIEFFFPGDYFEYCLDIEEPGEFGCCRGCSSWAVCRNVGRWFVLFNGQFHAGSISNPCRCDPSWMIGGTPDPWVPPFTC